MRNWAHAVVLSKYGCPYCEKAKELLEQSNIPYTEYAPTHSPWVMSFLFEAGFKTVPQIFIEGEHVGGYDDLVKWVNSRKS